MSKQIAVVGTGYWGKNLVRNFHQLGALAALCDSSPLAEASMGEKYPKVPYYRDFAEVLAKPEIDAIVLATPAAAHFSMAKRALEAGKDVFVEKPLALKAAEGDQLAELAHRNKRVLMVGHILQYHPAVIKLKQMIGDGSLGKLRYVYSNRLNIGKIRTEENILWSFAPHDISVILSLLGEEPGEVSCEGSSYLSESVADVTMSRFTFPSGVAAHIFVSWLHPFKEQRLVVVGSEKMAVFDDSAKDKLVLYPHKVEWKNRIPVAEKADAQPVELENSEPLAAECRHFLDCLESRRAPQTDGREGLRVLRVLEACQQSMQRKSAPTPVTAKPIEIRKPYFAHETAIVGDNAKVGAGTKIWHFSHIMNGSTVGENCIFGQNCHVASGVTIGDNVKVQNNVSIYGGAVIEDDVFLGPSCVLTNVSNPRSQVNRHSLYETTIFRRGVTVGANATIVCGIELGRYAFIAAGAVVTRNVPDYALMAESPARRIGWMSRHGHRLERPDANGIMVCPESGFRYKEVAPRVLRCLDLDEETPLPENLRMGTVGYRELRNRTAAGQVEQEVAA
jgi:UDP-2-acetamido-3-amino-2,3-dideoxy-glucuronate N-acetyltransferase